LLVVLDLELDALASENVIEGERLLEARSMEVVLTSIFGSDEA